VYKTVHILHVQGQVFDQAGEKIPGAKITIKRGPDTIAESTADQDGKFRLNVPPGEYDVNVNAPGFAPGYSHVKVGFGLKSAFHSSSVKIILPVGTVCIKDELGIRQEMSGV
jgi:hypothetical protein